jgi:TPP-dependent pyruvate/acetoin dehydrogenase alpha subunit
VQAGLLNEAAFDEMVAAAQAEMDRAVAFAESSPLPAPEEALEDLFAGR